MAKVPLFGTYKFYGFALVDDQDFERVASIKWGMSSTGYARHRGSLRGDKHGIFMHRYVINAPEGFMVDHINGNKIDNRRSNLRLVTNQQNQWNSKISTTNTSGYKGVARLPRKHEWRAQIKVHMKYITLGNYISKEAAAIAYDAAARHYFGEYARLNFPDLWIKLENSRGNLDNRG